MGPPAYRTAGVRGGVGCRGPALPRCFWFGEGCGCQGRTWVDTVYVDGPQEWEIGYPTKCRHLVITQPRGKGAVFENMGRQEARVRFSQATREGRKIVNFLTGCWYVWNLWRLPSKRQIEKNQREWLKERVKTLNSMAGMRVRMVFQTDDGVRHELMNLRMEELFLTVKYSGGVMEHMFPVEYGHFILMFDARKDGNESSDMSDVRAQDSA